MHPSASLLLANRAYLDHESPRWADSPSAAGNGGLLACVRPVIAPWDGAAGTTWIGAGMGRYDREWTDERGFELVETARGPLRHRRLYFGPAQWQGHYAEVSNSFTWPLFHLVRADLPALTGYYPVPAPPTPADWNSFAAVNDAFAEAAAEETDAESCWIHDYQLALVPALLRNRGFAGKIGFFLHIPFPDVEVAAPYLEAEAGVAFANIISGMLGAGLIGLQTPPDCDRFLAAAVALTSATLEPGGLRYEDRHVEVGAFPVGIDIEDVLQVARTSPTPARVEAARERGLPLVVGLERGDFTKGIPERLQAMAIAAKRGARFAYLGIAAPTREGVRAYDALENAIEEASVVARPAIIKAGGTFAHVRANVGFPDVVALQREADVVFTSSLADGQNLVPLQAAAAQSLRPPGERGLIITGRDAGVASAYADFGRDGLVATDPLNIPAMAEDFCEALAGRPGRVSDRFVEQVARHDARAWATEFLTRLEATC